MVGALHNEEPIGTNVRDEPIDEAGGKRAVDYRLLFIRLWR